MLWYKFCKVLDRRYKNEHLTTNLSIGFRLLWLGSGTMKRFSLATRRSTTHAGKTEKLKPIRKIQELTNCNPGSKTFISSTESLRNDVKGLFKIPFKRLPNNICIKHYVKNSWSRGQQIPSKVWYANGLLPVRGGWSGALALRVLGLWWLGLGHVKPVECDPLVQSLVVCEMNRRKKKMKVRSEEWKGNSNQPKPKIKTSTMVKMNKYQSFSHIISNTFSQNLREKVWDCF